MPPKDTHKLDGGTLLCKSSEASFVCPMCSLMCRVDHDSFVFFSLFVRRRLLLLFFVCSGAVVPRLCNILWIKTILSTGKQWLFCYYPLVCGQMHVTFIICPCLALINMIILWLSADWSAVQGFLLMNYLHHHARSELQHLISTPRISINEELSCSKSDHTLVTFQRSPLQKFTFFYSIGKFTEHSVDV